MGYQLIAGLFCLGLFACNPSSDQSSSDTDAAVDAATTNTVRVYADAYETGWTSWSWGATLNPSNTKPLYAGAKSLAVQLDAAWGAAYLHNDTAQKTVNRLRFWIHGGTTGNQKIRAVLIDGAGKTLEPGLAITTKANAWTKYDIPFEQLGSPSSVTGINWQDTAGAAQPIFYLDSVSLAYVAPPPVTGTVNPDPVEVPSPETSGLPNNGRVYSDDFAPGWQNWSWTTTINPANATAVYAGQKSISVQYTSPWAAAYFHNDTVFAPANRVRFWIHGGTAGNQKIRVLLTDAGGQMVEPGLAITPVANKWTQFDIPFSQLGSPDGVTGVSWQDTSGAAQPAFYLDSIGFAQVGPVLPTPTIALTVDAAQNRKSISPGIYGINFANETVATELRLPVRRFGGNSTSRYNYLQDATNRAMDWYFENIPETNTNPTALPEGSASNKFVEQNKRTSTETLMTMPMIGYVAKSRDVVCGFSVAKYNYIPQDKDSSRTDCGNGKKADGTAVTGNDPLDTSIVTDPAFVEAWVNYLKNKFGPASAGGVQYYNLDNEPGLWNDTHRDVHPQPLSYDELATHSLDYAAAIKRADPSAKIAGPAEWGWVGYMYSAKDVAAGGSWWDTRPDRKAHGDTELTAWYLQQMKAAETRNGKRLLDYLDLHFYPQGTNVYSEDVAPATRSLRLRSTRGLWDPNYTDESWIGQPVRLIPRMKDWVAQNYPGTKLAIGEYSFGATNNINGAIAEADALGIFGREGVDMALLWPSGSWPLESMSATAPTVLAMKMYRNYDGAGAGFGNTSVQASSASEDKVSVFAAEKTGALTVMIVNKRESAQPITLALQNKTATTARVFRYDASNTSTIQKLPDVAVVNGSLALSLPASSITLLEVK